MLMDISLANWIVIGLFIVVMLAIGSYFNKQASKSLDSLCSDPGLAEGRGDGLSGPLFSAYLIFQDWTAALISGLTLLLSFGLLKGALAKVEFFSDETHAIHDKNLVIY
jgi:hypothetical protein